MPKVTLIDFTGKGSLDEAWYAADILIFTKSTRLLMEPEGLEEIISMSNSEKQKILSEMVKTIPSSWEFVDLTFLFSGVTRACAQQITRTRTASYSMQSQRAVDMTDALVTNPYLPAESMHRLFAEAAADAVQSYRDMIAYGAEPQDARGLLPMNAQCNLLAKYNLRAFADLVRSRSSLRTQSEYAEIIHLAVVAVKTLWPWVGAFLEPTMNVAISELEDVAQELGVVPGSGLGWRVAKAIDLIRRTE